MPSLEISRNQLSHASTAQKPPPAHPASLDPPAPLARRDPLETMPMVADVAHLAQPVQLDHPALLVPPDQRDPTALLARPPKRPELPAQTDHQAPQASQVRTDPPATPATQEHPAPPDLREMLARLAELARTEPQDQRDLRESAEAPAAATTAHHHARRPAIKRHSSSDSHFAYFPAFSLYSPDFCSHKLVHLSLIYYISRWLCVSNLQ